MCWSAGVGGLSLWIPGSMGGGETDAGAAVQGQPPGASSAPHLDGLDVRFGTLVLHCNDTPGSIRKGESILHP